MRKLLLGIIVASAVAGGGLVLVEHDTEAGEVSCAGQRQSNGKCDLVWLNYSVESRYSATRSEGDDPDFRDQDRANCPRGTDTSPECYRSYTHTQETSAGWGTDASTTLVPAAGPFGGVRYGIGDGGSGEGKQDARVWSGVNVADGGQGSAAIGAGRNESNDPYLCATGYGKDQTEDRVIVDALNDAGISDDRTDDDSDVQFCGEFLRGPL